MRYIVLLWKSALAMFPNLTLKWDITIPCQVFKKTANNRSYLIWGMFEDIVQFGYKKNVKRIEWNSSSITPLTPGFFKDLRQNIETPKVLIYVIASWSNISFCTCGVSFLQLLFRSSGPSHPTVNVFTFLKTKKCLSN